MENNNVEKNHNEKTNQTLLDEDSSNVNKQFQEEIATEITDKEVIESRNDPDINNIYGWVGLGLSVISFFIIPLLFAGAGIILGFIARGREAQVLGNTAIITGVISILFRLFILPLI